ncbi:MAG: radical SAM protein, partial [Pseudomonadota bacterium]
MPIFMSLSEMIALRPEGRQFSGTDRREPLRSALEQAGEFTPLQTAGRFYPIACVALEITQRCNLDCTLCYLSEHAEAAVDVPLVVLTSRIAMVESHYGPGTSIQISGGDPTLRKIEDLEYLCAEIRRRGMRSCLMTNGIRATRSFLSRLARSGLDDVAFHVDLTQQRRGFETEVQLNAVRCDYLARARGLGLRVLFNTTVYGGNRAELPALAAFFRDHADEVTLASFQMQAETGRGVLGRRGSELTQQSVMDALSDGIGTPIDFESAGVGHRACNRFAPLLVAGGEALPALGDPVLSARAIAALERVEQQIDGHVEIRATAFRLAKRYPLLALRLFGHLIGRLWSLRRGMIRSRGRLHRLSILVHNFMDARELDPDRCASCVFMAMTEDGPLSMCVHNARRDHHLFTPARIETDAGEKWWSAATGEITDAPFRSAPAPLP